MEIKAFTGDEVSPYITALATLRIKVFRDYPYCYDGSLTYEEQYLHTFATAKRSLLLLAFDGSKMVGASTALPMSEAPQNISSSWQENGFDIDRIFYFGESVLDKAYRGQGLGKRFFVEREAWAHRFNQYHLLCFCGVIRPKDDPRQPTDYQPLDTFWHQRGYVNTKGYTCQISWKELTETDETAKDMQFWHKVIPLKNRN